VQVTTIVVQIFDFENISWVQGFRKIKINKYCMGADSLFFKVLRTAQVWFL
jgi:hypothetical protein